MCWATQGVGQDSYSGWIEGPKGFILGRPTLFRYLGEIDYDQTLSPQKTLFLALWGQPWATHGGLAGALLSNPWGGGLAKSAWALQLSTKALLKAPEVQKDPILGEILPSHSQEQGGNVFCMHFLGFFDFFFKSVFWFLAHCFMVNPFFRFLLILTIFAIFFEILDFFLKLFSI